MCGRYLRLTEKEVIELHKIFNEIALRIINDDYEDGPGRDGEVRPTDTAPVIIHQDVGAVSIDNLQWGFKKWDGKGVIINARVETLHIKNMFSKLLYAGRCVVPAGEYYEWETVGNNKVKHFVKDKNCNLLFMAGLYREAPDDGGREFVIITKDADEAVGKIHDRMPVLLTVGQIEDWLSGKLSPDDIVKTDFNMDVEPCPGEFVQLTL